MGHDDVLIWDCPGVAMNDWLIINSAINLANSIAPLRNA